MTPDEKATIIAYVQKQVGPAVLRNPAALLAYYLDHADELDPKVLVDVVKQAKVDTLKQKIAQATDELAQLDSAAVLAAVLKG